jgi:hypothetical protein
MRTHYLDKITVKGNTAFEGGQEGGVAPLRFPKGEGKRRPRDLADECWLLVERNLQFLSIAAARENEKGHHSHWEVVSLQYAGLPRWGSGISPP